MKTHLLVAAGLLACSFVSAASTVDSPRVSSWDRASAMAAVRTVDVNAAVNAIGTPSELLDGQNIIGNIKALENRSDWPMPAREATIYQFTRSLAALPRDSVDADIVSWLSAYQARVLVAHEDHAESAVPLFNIRGAATGVKNGWLREDSASEALALLNVNPQALVGKFLQSNNHSQQSGYLDALQHAGITDVKVVQNTALEQLDSSPELTPLLATTAVITDDPYAARRLLIDGRGAGLASAFETLAEGKDSSETAAMLKLAIMQAPAENAALAIAAWWPALRHDTATRQLLLNKLGDDALGAPAALALAQSPDIQTIRELQLLAEGDTRAARRAQLALSINRDLLVAEVQK